MIRHPGVAAPEAVEQEIERLLVETRPVIDDVLAPYLRSGTLLTRQDAEDVAATVQLRLVRKLRELAAAPQTEPIHDLRGYAARLTYNAVNDHLRRQFPERARLKARLRYTLTHDQRLALWPGTQGPVCGLAEWRDRADAAGEVAREVVAAIASVERHDSAGALLQLFRIIDRPVLFDAVVDAVAAAWKIVDQASLPLDDLAAASSSRQHELDFVRALWSEILLLPPMQRKALLLNLRYGGESNVISLLVLAGVARFDEIAAALEMSRAELAAIWKSLPIEDAKIAERFGISRQRVINLRSAARERLWRRLRS